MKKALKKQAAFVMLSAAVAVQTGFPGYAATSVTGSWANEDGGWKFYNSDHQAYTGWVKTENGWYYLNPTDGKMVTGWQKIDGFWYYFETAQEGIEGRMHTGWYKTAENTWYFFENGSGSATEGHMVTGWQWIDGYCYYFSAQPGIQGAMYAGRRTPDDYLTNADGQWTQDGQIIIRVSDSARKRVLPLAVAQVEVPVREAILVVEVPTVAITDQIRIRVPRTLRIPRTSRTLQINQTLRILRSRRNTNIC